MYMYTYMYKYMYKHTVYVYNHVKLYDQIVIYVQYIQLPWRT